jgi:hypothetical protein
VEVEFEFLKVLEDTLVKRPNFKCKYGLVMRSGNTLEDLGKRAIDPFKYDNDHTVILLLLVYTLVSHKGEITKVARCKGSVVWTGFLGTSVVQLRSI